MTSFLFSYYAVSHSREDISQDTEPCLWSFVIKGLL